MSSKKVSFASLPAPSPPVTSLCVEPSVSTSCVRFVETEHGRARREQRGIDKRDLQRAKRYGTRTSSYPRANGDRTARYIYKDIVYITNESTGEEVTCYPVPIKLTPVKLNDEMMKEDENAKHMIQANRNSWKSNTVIVVDTSGSMRKSDVWGTKTRLDSVWLSLALDFVANRIETGAAGAMDVLSIVLFGNDSDILIKEEPTSWSLYNKLVDIYNEKKVQPYGHGFYMASFDQAEELLLKNSNADCAMGLCFMSDGKPSDAQNYSDSHEYVTQVIVDRVASLAKKFGRRLQFDAIGIGSYDDFHTLRDMVREAKDYGAQATFKLPSMSSNGIGDMLLSFATSVTTTQTEMTDMNTLTQKTVRNVDRESRRKAGVDVRTVSSDDFWIYNQDAVKRFVYSEEYDGLRHKGSFKKAHFQHPKAKCFAFARAVFGEGAERFAYRFYELSEDGRTIVGKPLVAKESRFVVDEQGVGSENERAKFAEQFCRTQQLARRIANEFNEKLDSMPRVDTKTPRVAFLDCSVYKMKDVGLGEVTVLVEERIDHSKWKKWNSNDGFVAGMKEKPTFNSESLVDMMSTSQPDLEFIEEGSDEEDSEEENELEQGIGTTLLGNEDTITFSPFEVAQAFSHFSYWATGRKRLICDIQGVYDEKENILKLSDPVIHYNSQHGRVCVHGRTDRGKKGMHMFFDTHKEYCNGLCRLMTRGFKKRYQEHCRPAWNLQTED